MVEQGLRAAVGHLGVGLVIDTVKWVADRFKPLKKLSIANSIYINLLELNFPYPVIQQVFLERLSGKEDFVDTGFDKAEALILLESESGVFVADADVAALKWWIPALARYVSIYTIMYSPSTLNTAEAVFLEPTDVKVLVSSQYRYVIRVFWDFADSVFPWTREDKIVEMNMRFPLPYLRSTRWSGYALLNLTFQTFGEREGLDPESVLEGIIPTPCSSARSAGE